MLTRTLEEDRNVEILHSIANAYDPQVGSSETHRMAPISRHASYSDRGRHHKL